MTSLRVTIGVILRVTPSIDHVLAAAVPSIREVPGLSTPCPAYDRRARAV